MKVLLLQRVPSLGNPGTIVEVAESYARNFLLPKKLATAATTEAIKRQQRATETQARDQAQRLAHQEKIFSELQSIILEITAAASPNGTLFAALQERDIRGALARNHQLQLPLKMQIRGLPLKHAGLTELTLISEQQQSGTLRVNIKPI